MTDNEYIIRIVLKARDDATAALALMRKEMTKMEDITKTVDARMDKFSATMDRMRQKMDQTADRAEKLRRGIRSIGGEDIKISADLDAEGFDKQIKQREGRLREYLVTVEDLRRKEKTINARYDAEIQQHRDRIEKARIDKKKQDGEGLVPITDEKGNTVANEPSLQQLINNDRAFRAIVDQSSAAIDELEKKRKSKLGGLPDELKSAETQSKRLSTEITNLNVKLQRAEWGSDKLKDLDVELERTVRQFRKFQNEGRKLGDVAREIRRVKSEMEGLGAEDVSGRIGLHFQKAKNEVDSFRITVRETERDTNRLGRGASLLNYFKNLETRTEGAEGAIARFDNVIRGFTVLFIVAQFQGLISAAIALGGALTGVAGSALSAGIALGGALTAGAAQALPVVGLLAAAVGRVKGISDALKQATLADKQEGTNAGKSADALRGATERVTSAQESLRDANERLTDSQKDLNKARAEARREIEDLILAQRRSDLQLQGSRDALRLARASGDTGALAGAELDVEESQLDSGRANSDARSARSRGVEGSERVKNATKSLRDAEQAVTRARRTLNEAARDSGDAGEKATVAAKRNLDYLLSQLSPAERRLYNSIQNIKATFKETFRPITDVIIDAFARTTDRVEQVISSPRLVKAFTKLADVGAGQIDKITGAFTDKGSVNFFEKMTRESARNLAPLTDIIISLGKAFMNIAEAASPALRRILDYAKEWADSFKRTTDESGKMTRLFNIGEKHLEAWLDLARAIGKLMFAIIFPGGQLERGGQGAAASGLRSINSLTEQVDKATKFINKNGDDVNKFFKDSERSTAAILHLLGVVAITLADVFSPDRVEDFAGFLELIVPVLGEVSEAVGAILGAFEALLSLPGISTLFQYGFGFVAFMGVAGKAKTLLLAMLHPVSIMAQRFLQTGTYVSTFTSRLGLARSTTAALLTTTGGLSARWAAANAQVTAYNASVAKAAAGGAIVPVGATRGGRPGAPTGAPRGTVPPVVPLAGAGGGIAGGAVAERTGALAGITRGLGVLGRLAGPLAAFSAAITFATTEGGLRQRARGAVSGATLGIASPDNLRKAGDFVQDKISSSPLRAAPVIGDVANVFGKAFGSSQQEKTLDSVKKKLEEVKKGSIAANKELTRDDITKRWDDLNGTQKQTVDQLIKVHNEGVRVKRLFGQDIKLRIDVDPSVARKSLSLVRNEFGRMRSGAVLDIKELREVTESNFKRIESSVGVHTKDAQFLLRRNFRLGLQNIKEFVKDGSLSVSQGGKEIERLLKVHSGEGTKGLKRNFAEARAFIFKTMRDSEGVTDEGLSAIRRIMARELRLYGLSEEAIKFRLEGKEQSGKSIGGIEQGNFTNKAVGGYLGAPGERGKDIITTNLGRGEAVLNYAHQKVVEPALRAVYGFGLPGLFKKVRGEHSAPIKGQGGMARGGIVPVPGFPGESANTSILDEIAFITKRFGLTLTDAYGQGHQSPGHTLYGTAADFSGGDRAMDAAVRYLVRKGYKVGYDGRFGSENWPDHGPSYVTPNFHLHAELGAKGGKGLPDVASATFKAIKRVKITGGADSPIRRIAQKALDVARNQANRRLKQLGRKAGVFGGREGHEGGGGAAAPPGQVRNWLRTALNKTNMFSQANLNALYGRTMQESGGNPRAINLWDSNAAAGHPSKGLIQTIDSTFQAYKMKGHNDIYNPIDNAIAAIRYMMARYGHIVGPSGSGYAEGGIVGGPFGKATNIMAHAGEWVLNKTQQMKAAALAGVDPSRLKAHLGFGGGPKEFKEGGEVGGGPTYLTEQERRKQIRQGNYQLPEELPLDMRGLTQEVNRVFRAIREVPRKGIKAFKTINDTLTQLTKDGGLLDQMGENIDRFRGNLETGVTRFQFDIGKKGTVIQRASEDQLGRRTLRNLDLVAERFRDIRRSINRASNTVDRQLSGIARRIRRLNRGEEDKGQEKELNTLRNQRANLRTQDTNLQTRLRSVDATLAEMIQQRFDAQAEALRRTLTRRLSGVTGFQRGLDIRQRINQATGRGAGDQYGIQTAQISLLQQQRAITARTLRDAKRQGNTELVNELRESIQELDVSIAEAVASRLNDAITRTQEGFDRARRRLDIRGRLLDAAGAVGLNRVVPGIGTSRAQVIQDRTGVAQLQIHALTTLLAQARRENNVTAINQLTDAIDDLKVEIAENSRALFIARVEEINRKTQTALGDSEIRRRITQARVDLGQITGEQGQASLKQQFELVAGELGTQRAGLEKLLLEATAKGDEEQMIALNTALLENEAAILDNTKAMKELDGSLNTTQSFSSSAWQWMRTAIFNGSGGILPEFANNIPSAAVGADVMRSGALFVHEGEKVVPAEVARYSGGDTSNAFNVGGIHINEAGQHDPDYLVNRLMFEYKTRGT